MKKAIIALSFLLVLGAGCASQEPGKSDASMIKKVKKSLVSITSSRDKMTMKEKAILMDQEDKIPTFTEVDFDFTHKYNKKAKPFLGSAAFDVDGDGVDEVFIGGGEGQDDAFFRYTGNGFERFGAGSSFNGTSATYGVSAIDIDNDSDVDLLLARREGVYLYTNQDGSFTEGKIDVSFQDKAFPFSIAAGDINNDGAVDLFISTFIVPDQFKAATFNVSNHRTANVMLLNDGNNNFQDITNDAGLSYEQNVFLTSFIDLNNDDWQDLVVAPNTDVVRIFENNRDNTFREHIGYTDFGFWMGLTAGDIDKDGDQDLFFTNTGTTIPDRFARGDLRSDQVFDGDWVMLRNDGNFKFTQVQKELNLSGYEFAWGALLEDMNLDSRLDLIVAENYIKWPAHKLKKLPGRFLVQDSSGHFVPAIEETGATNRHYGITPLVSDFNQDGFPDLVYVNLDGPSKAYINDGGLNHYITIALPDNTDSLGARVRVIMPDRSIIERHVISSNGFLSDQSADLIFGLGVESSVRQVEIIWRDGEKKIIDGDDVEIDSRIVIRK